MELDMRPITADERQPFARAVEAAFGHVNPEEEVDLWAKATDPARTLAVFDAGEIVANTAAWAMEITLPGLVSVPTAGVTAVGVAPTHRRQGLLTRMMAQQLDDCLEWGEPVAILTASESVIYGRFGYGWASSIAGAEVNCRYSAFTRPARAEGRIRRVDKDAAAKIAPALHDVARRRTLGDVSTPQVMWDMMAADFDHRRDGASAMFFAVHEAASGEPDGFLSYRYKHDYRQGNPDHTAIVTDLFGTSPEVEAALFRYALDLDLVAKVAFDNRPVDDHLRRRLADPRRYAVTGLVDNVWVRLVDVPAALALRRYTADGSVVIEVHDAFRPQNDGRYIVEGGPDGAICAPTKDDADVAVTVESLGAAYLGGVSFAALAEAGRAEEVRPGGFRRADALFLTDVQPYCRNGF